MVLASGRSGLDVTISRRLLPGRLGGRPAIGLCDAAWLACMKAPAGVLPGCMLLVVLLVVMATAWGACCPPPPPVAPAGRDALEAGPAVVAAGGGGRGMDGDNAMLVGVHGSSTGDGCRLLLRGRWMTGADRQRGGLGPSAVST